MINPYSLEFRNDPYGISDSVLGRESLLANVEQELQMIKELTKKEAQNDPYLDL